MKQALLFFCTLLVFQVFAANGDTTTIRAFDKFHMNRYGNFDKRVGFPSSDKKSQRIWLRLTLGCLSNGQCEWDYTLKVAIRENTGKKDSTLKQAPSFRVNGNIQDSLLYSSDTTWINSFNSTTKKTDSVPAAKYTIIRYLNTLTPTTPTDTIIGWAANFYRYTFDSTGKKIDSTFIASNSKITKVNTPYYDVFDVINTWEMARLITPYAKFFPKTFQYQYIFDVTDFMPYLHDSADVRITYEGYTYGFTSTIDFHFIEGITNREPIRLEKVYSGYFPYGNPNNSIENYLTLKTFKIDSNIAESKLRIMVTGHGGEQNENCAEFCKKNYYLKINNNTPITQSVWRDNCGSNPIINQGGTWIYDRSNWCPGELIKPFEYTLTAKANDSLKIELDMDDFTANGSAGYGYEAYLVYYKSNQRAMDAGIEEIMAPTNNFWHSKYNPACDHGRVRIKNFGKETINYVRFKFKAGNAPVQTGEFFTTLLPNESVEAPLYYINWQGDLSNKTFEVWIDAVNWKPDTYTDNNTLKSTFNITQTIPLRFVVETRTNQRPTDNDYSITDTEGRVKFSKVFTQPNTTHYDTVTLGYGCYTFKFNDKGGNGLSFWNPPVEGAGYVRFMNAYEFGLLKTFTADFGNFTQFNFTTGSPVGQNELSSFKPSFNIYPQPASEMIHLQCEHIYPVSIELIDLHGRLAKSYSADEIARQQLPIRGIQQGIYLLQLKGTKGELLVKKVVIE
jgi:hypothetical protein